jgi:hypothetical protein
MLDGSPTPQTARWDVHILKSQLSISVVQHYCIVFQHTSPSSGKTVINYPATWSAISLSDHILYNGVNKILGNANIFYVTCLLTYSSLIPVHNICQQTAPGTLAHKLRVFQVFTLKPWGEFSCWGYLLLEQYLWKLKTERQNEIKCSINYWLLLTFTVKMLNVKIVTAEDSWILILL